MNNNPIKNNNPDNIKAIVIGKRASKYVMCCMRSNFLAKSICVHKEPAVNIDIAKNPNPAETLSRLNQRTDQINKIKVPIPYATIAGIITM